MTEAEAQFVAAVAELRRAEGLWRGMLTADKKALLEQRLSAARTALAKSFTALRLQACDPDPLPAGRDARELPAGRDARQLTVVRERAATP